MLRLMNLLPYGKRYWPGGSGGWGEGGSVILGQFTLGDGGLVGGLGDGGVGDGSTLPEKWFELFLRPTSLVFK